MEFDEPSQAINYLVDLQAKNRLSIESLADSFPKIKKENTNLKNEVNQLRNQNTDLQREVDDLRKKLKDMTERYQGLVDKLMPVLQAVTHNKRELRAALELMGAFIPRGSTIDDQLPSGKDEAKLLAAIGTQNDNIEKLIKLLGTVGSSLKDRPDLPELVELARKIDSHRRALITEFNLAFSVDFTDTSRITQRDETQPKSVVRSMTETMEHVGVIWEEFRGEFQKKVKLLQAELEKLRSEKDQLVVANKDLETEISKKIGSISKLQIKIFMLMSFLKTRVGQ
jgi:FtsZ-binding cell division protein ZapB